MADHQKGPSSSKTSSHTLEHPQRTATAPLPEIPADSEPFPPPPPPIAFRKVSADDDLVYNLTRRDVNDYQSLDRNSGSRPPGAPSPGKPSTSAPTIPDPKPSLPSTSRTPTSSSSSSARDGQVTYLASDNTRPEPRVYIHQPGSSRLQQAPVCSEEIVELHSKPEGDLPEDKENEAAGDMERSAEVTNVPNTNFAIACMVTLCFNLPLGVLAMYFSLKAVRAYQEGQTKLGQKRSRWSIFISLLGIAFTTVLVSSIVLYIAMQGQRRISQYRAYSVKSGLSL